MLLACEWFLAVVGLEMEMGASVFGMVVCRMLVWLHIFGEHSEYEMKHLSGNRRLFSKIELIIRNSMQEFFIWEMSDKVFVVHSL